MFYEECHHPVTNLVNGGMKEDFIPHVYDENEYDQPSDAHEEGHPDFLYKHCNQHVEIFVSDVLKNIYACLYMMNVRMATWIMHLKNQQYRIIDWITKKKRRIRIGMFLYVFQIQKLFCLTLLKNTIIFTSKYLEGINF